MEKNSKPAYTAVRAASRHRDASDKTIIKVGWQNNIASNLVFSDSEEFVKSMREGDLNLYKRKGIFAWRPWRETPYRAPGRR